MILRLNKPIDNFPSGGTKNTIARKPVPADVAGHKNKAAMYAEGYEHHLAEAEQLKDATDEPSQAKWRFHKEQANTNLALHKSHAEWLRNRKEGRELNDTRSEITFTCDLF